MIPMTTTLPKKSVGASADISGTGTTQKDQAASILAAAVQLYFLVRKTLEKMSAYRRKRRRSWLSSD